jgi:hypothetical protein
LRSSAQAGKAAASKTANTAAPEPNRVRVRAIVCAFAAVTLALNTQSVSQVE